jgi:hypothetical protein
MRRSQSNQMPFIWPLILVVAGVLLLLNNFMLIPLNVLEFWPIVLILVGLQLLWRGDLAPSWQAQTFGITRGSVTAGALEISSGEIDVRLQAARRPDRLIMGQYTARSRPSLTVRNNRAQLTMRRGNTWLFSFADWEVNVAQNLPWSLLISAHIGQLDVDLRGLQIAQAYVASGIGDIRLVCPVQPGGPLFARSTLGDVRLAVPEGIPALIRVKTSPFCRVLRHSRRFLEQPDQLIVTDTYSPEAPALDITVSSTFGNIHLITVPVQLNGDDQM